MTLVGFLFIFFVVFLSSVLRRPRGQHPPHSLFRRVLLAAGLGTIGGGLLVTNRNDVPANAHAALPDAGPDGGKASPPAMPPERTGDVLVIDPPRMAGNPIMAVECTAAADPLIGICRVRDNRL